MSIPYTLYPPVQNSPHNTPAINLPPKTNFFFKEWLWVSNNRHSCFNNVFTDKYLSIYIIVWERMLYNLSGKLAHNFTRVEHNGLVGA